MKPEHIRIFREIPEDYLLNINPYVSKLRESCITGEVPALYGPYLSGKKANWHKEFPKSKGLIVEIGCHKGKNLSHLQDFYAAVNKCSSEELLQIAKKYFSASSFSELVVGPSSNN